MKRLLGAVIAVAVIAGCAKSSSQVGTTYVSPLMYQSMNCAQIQMELLRVRSAVSEIGGKLDTAANNDQALTAIGFVLFWPAFIFLGNNEQQEADYARLKGEHDALSQAYIRSDCARPGKGDATASAPLGPTVVPAAASASGAVVIASAVPTAAPKSAAVTPSVWDQSGDAAKIAFPSRLPDRSVRLGHRSIQGDRGEWYLTARSGIVAKPRAAAANFSNSINQMTAVGSSVGVVVADDDGLRMVFALDAPAGYDVAFGAWDDATPCALDHAIHREVYSSNIDRPECLLIRQASGGEDASLPASARAAAGWAKRYWSSSVEQMYEYRYVNYGYGTFVSFTALVPATRFRDRFSAIEWGRSLKGVLQPWTRSSGVAVLPPV